ncbi:hypothetical protein Gotur_028843 [Gossypium turneri]
MERGFLDKVEDNAAVRIWSQKIQQEKGDSLAKGYVSELWDFTRISVTQNNLQYLKRYGISGAMRSDRSSIVTMVDLVPTVEEYTTLLRCPMVQVNKAYSRAANVPTFLKKLMNITGMSEQWHLRFSFFPKALGHVDEAVSDLFDRLDKGVRKVSYRVFSKNYSPLKEIVATPRRDDVSEEKWIMIIQNLQEEDIE